jgi:hypothetical protein
MAKVMLVFLQMSMDPLKLYKFLFRMSGPGKLMNMPSQVMTTPQREDLEKEQIEQTTYKMHALAINKKCSCPYHVKSPILTWLQIKTLYIVYQEIALLLLFVLSFFV